jgi:acetyl esterase/lipase
MKNLLSSLLLCFLAAGCTGGEVLERITRDGGNEVATNVVYDPARKLRLDVFTPRAARNAPVVVFFGGGRWETGVKEDFRFVGNKLASSSFVVVIPDYRKYPKARFPGIMEDAAHAMKWVNDNIARYGGSPDKVFVMGHSAGAHIAALLALNPEHLKAVGLERDRLRGMIGLAGPYDFMPISDPTLRDVFAPPDRFEQSQPIFFVDGRNPPLLLVHGEDDEDIYVRNTRSLAQAVINAGGAVETLIYSKLSHSCAVAVLSNKFSCGNVDPDLTREIARFVRAKVKAAP